ncbi:transmembrane protein 163-like isoform X2 [Biomphalaria glabrata]|uniref:Transmembrane protein 163-like isoform X2 n=1 Tax=Biomphalaria glabrata TaxID=6526 RepID=A0A9W3AXE9_BIOGL|nr:transmembrane protein 163-like isoform X2 [Biomphalaria glabrata]
MKIKKQERNSSKFRESVTYTALQVTEAKNGEIENGEADNATNLNSSKGNQLRTAALVVSWLSVLFAFFTGVAAIVLGQLWENQSLFGYGLDGVLDSLSSVAVLWRFYGSGTSAVAEAKERKACIVIAVFFFASALSLIVKSTVAIVNNTKEDEESRIFSDTFSVVCGSVAFGLASSKVYIGRKLESRSLLTDSIITYVGSVMSFLGVLGLELYRSDDRVWYLDAVFGLVCGFFLCAFGMKLMVDMTCHYKNKEPLLTAS